MIVFGVNIKNAAVPMPFLRQKTRIFWSVPLAGVAARAT